jgi:hypothetical protein
MTNDELSEEIGRLAKAAGVNWTAAAARASARRTAKTDAEYRLALVAQYERAKVRFDASSGATE